MSGQDDKHACATPIKVDDAGEKRTIWFETDCNHVLGNEIPADHQAARESSTLALLCHTVAVQLSHAQLIDDALLPLLRTLCAMLHGEIGAYWDQQNDTGTLRCRVCYSKPGAQVYRFELVTRELAVVPGEGLVGRAWTSRALQWVPDLPTDPSFHRTLAARSSGLRSGLTIPIPGETATRAVLEVYGHNLVEPVPLVRAALEAMAAQVQQFLLRLDAEEAQQRSEQQLSLVLEQAPVILLATDATGQITLSEGRALQELGRMPGEDVGRSIDEIFAASPQLIAGVRQALTGQIVQLTISFNATLLDLAILPQYAAGQVIGTNAVALISRIRHTR